MVPAKLLIDELMAEAVMAMQTAAGHFMGQEVQWRRRPVTSWGRRCNACGGQAPGRRFCLTPENSGSQKEVLIVYWDISMVDKLHQLIAGTGDAGRLYEVSEQTKK